MFDNARYSTRLIAHYAAIACGVGKLDGQQRELLAAASVNQGLQGVGLGQRHIARQHHHHTIVRQQRQGLLHRMAGTQLLRLNGAADIAIAAEMVAHRIGLVPGDGEMVRSLGAMYTPAFGPWANGAFLVEGVAPGFSLEQLLPAALYHVLTLLFDLASLLALMAVGIASLTGLFHYLPHAVLAATTPWRRDVAAIFDPFGNATHTAEISRLVFIGTQSRACDTTGTATEGHALMAILFSLDSDNDGLVDFDYCTAWRNNAKPECGGILDSGVAQNAAKCKCDKVNTDLRVPNPLSPPVLEIVKTVMPATGTCGVDDKASLSLELGASGSTAQCRSDDRFMIWRA